MVGDTMQLVADDVQTLIVPGTGHWVAEQAPEELVAALETVAHGGRASEIGEEASLFALVDGEVSYAVKGPQNRQTVSVKAL